MRGRPGSETFAAHEYTRQETKPSKFDSDRSITIDVGLTCPRCKGALPLLEHGKNTTCGYCGLRLELHGNGLTVWEG